MWQTFTVAIAGSLAVLLVFGLITGKGDFGNLFGADWSTVSWSDIGTMLVVTAIIAAIVIPLAWFVLPRAIKNIGTAFVAVSVIVPLGLIAPGFAYGEGSTTDVQAAFGYVPSGLDRLSSFFSAPLGSYNIPLPFFNDANAALWHAAIGYELSGMMGILLVGAATLGLAALAKRLAPGPAGRTSST